MRRKYTGKDLLKVLVFYGIINDDVPTSEFSIVCPFHDDINPSMRINLSDGTFFCFGCGLYGNAYDFVKNAQPELSDLQVCIYLEKIINSKEIKKINANYKKKKKINNHQAIIEADDYFYGLKTMDWYGDLEEEEQRAYEYMHNRGFTKKDLNTADCRVSYNIAYPIIFPILDNGTFKGYVARTTNRYVEQKRKYLYNEGFRKRDTLSGTYEKDSIVFICEGYLDCLNLKTKGHLRNVVALLGWHISDEQIEKLKEKNIKTVVSVLDNDKSGEKGTRLLSEYFRVIRFEIPNKDVGEMTKEQIKKSLRKVRRELNEIKGKH